ncbi:MAG: efflux RND transporter periplasmic adaptor subunit, partial [Coxiellaceae bacterium]|nr:efflux RND transporter periplasmic adaptor subunit [Coxiellaceae bacterium]
MKNKWFLIIFLSLALFAGLLLRNWLIYPHAPKQSSENKILYWVAPIDPTYRRDAPGKSPMGMDLVPVYANDAQKKEGIISISPNVEHHLGVKQTTVLQKDLSRMIDTVGFATVDENR